METETLSMAQEMDFSLLALFFRASFVVQIVMVMLFAASIWVWAIAFSKFSTYRLSRRRAAQFDAAFWSGENNLWHEHPCIGVPGPGWNS